MSNSKGFCLIAQNNENTDYIRQAYALALSIHKFNRDQNVSLITDDVVPEEYKSVFDKIIPIPWGDLAEKTRWKIENRWKVYHITPYEHTIVMDVDMLVLENIESWWDYLDGKDLYFTSTVKTYRNETVTDRSYRKTFDDNNLPDLYSAFYYFKKSDKAFEFFTMLETVMKDWLEFYKKFLKVGHQNWCSFDLSTALAAKILGIDKEIVDYKTSPITFTHMKTKLQGWWSVPEKWSLVTDYHFNDEKLTVSNFVQTKVFHYVEDEFLTNELVEALK